MHNDRFSHLFDDGCRAQVNGTPLVRVEAGTLFCIDDSCFSPPSLHGAPSSSRSVEDPESSTPSKDGKPTQHLSRTFSTGTMLSNMDADTPGVPSCDRPLEELPLFHLDLLFTSTCNYIRLPKYTLKDALKEETYTTTTEIIKQLSIVSQTIISRISDLDIWNSANIGIRSDPKAPAEGSTWGVHQKEEHKRSHHHGHTVSGLHGTYKLPHAISDVLSEEAEDNEVSSGEMLAPLAPLLAKKSQSAQLFLNTELLDDDAV